MILNCSLRSKINNNNNNRDNEMEKKWRVVFHFVPVECGRCQVVVNFHVYISSIYKYIILCVCRHFSHLYVCLIALSFHIFVILLLLLLLLLFLKSPHTHIRASAEFDTQVNKCIHTHLHSTRYFSHCHSEKAEYSNEFDDVYACANCALTLSRSLYVCFSFIFVMAYGFEKRHSYI